LKEEKNVEWVRALHSFADIQITDRQNVDKITKNVDKMTENVDFIWQPTAGAKMIANIN
jgi:hypothetical protein